MPLPPRWRRRCVDSRSVENTQRRTAAQRHYGAVVCRHSRYAVVHWLTVVMYCPPFGYDSVWSTGLCQFSNNSARHGSVRVRGTS